MLAKTLVIRPGDYMAVPFDETYDHDGSVKTPKAFGLMYFVKTIDGKSEFSEWTMTLPEALGNTSFQIEAKGPRDIDTVCKARGLNGPNLSSWAGTVKVYRQGQEMGTVKELKEETARIRIASKKIDEERAHGEVSRGYLDRIDAIVQKSRQSIDTQAESKDGNSKDED